MSEISNRAIVIAVGLLVTISITSSVIMVLGYFKDIYSEVGNTNISLKSKFSEFDKYDNTTLTGLDILNGYNKYKDLRRGQIVEFFIDSNEFTGNMVVDDYYKKYSVTYEETDKGAIISCTSI